MVQGIEMDTADKRSSEGIIGLGDEIERIQKALTDFESGQKLDIAIISEPFAGRTTLITATEKMAAHKVTKRSFSSIVKNKEELLSPEQPPRIMIIDNCHFLYLRTIGGFDLLEDFLKSVVSSNNLFITTWNLYSWNYLDEVLNIGQFFPIQLKLPKFTPGELKELILSGYKENEVEFIGDVTAEEKRVITFVRYPVTLKQREKTITIPLFTINFNRLRFRLSRKEEEKKAEDIIFEMINRVSNGNPGVAKVTWAKSLEYPTIKPSYVWEPSFKIELDYTESFILYLILSMESINKEEVVEITGEMKVDKILYRLAQQGLITVDHGYYKIRPEALNSVVTHLKKSRVIW
ncbi:MAG: hypothetical protein IBX41_06460 [Methanophagales archaeon]|nr:hypothetical protein [Methanophagales archaeon]